MAKSGVYGVERIEKILDALESSVQGGYSRSFLRQELPITNGNTSYNFNLRADGTTAAIQGEARLKQEDLFVAIGVKTVLISAATNLQGQQKQYTYPNPDEFTTNQGANAANMEIFYNGILSITQEQKELVTSINTSMFRQVNESQQGVVVGMEDETVASQDGFVELLPFIIFSGQRTIKCQVNLPDATGLVLAATTANRQNRLGLIFDGFVIPSRSSALEVILTQLRAKKGNRIAA